MLHEQKTLELVINTPYESGWTFQLQCSDKHINISEANKTENGNRTDTEVKMLQSKLS